MYGKFFASAFTGSMMGAGPEVFSVWGYVIANTVDATVELNPKLLGAMIGTTPEAIQRAIDYLCASDPASRSKVEDGKRLIREGEYAYRVPNHAAYRSIQNEDDRREYNRQKQVESRARRSVKAPVIDSQSPSAMSAQAVNSKKKQKKQATATTSPAEGQPRTTWLSIYIGKWEEVYGTGSSATLNGQMAKALKPLHDVHGGPEVLRRLSIYLAETEARFASPTQFAQRFAGWGAGVVPERTRRNAAALTRLAEMPDAE